MKKVVCIVVWVLLTVFYIFLYRDDGRAMGAQSDTAIERWDEYRLKNALDAYSEVYFTADDYDNEELAQQLNDLLNENQRALDGYGLGSYKLELIDKKTMTGIAIYNVIYFVSSYALFTIAFKKEPADNGKD